MLGVRVLVVGWSQRQLRGDSMKPLRDYYRLRSGDRLYVEEDYEEVR
jgi:hypothetical protein